MTTEIIKWQILSRILEAVTKTRSFITDSFLLLLLCYFQLRKETEKVNKCIMIVFHYSAKYRHVPKLTDRNQNEKMGTRQDNMNNHLHPTIQKYTTVLGPHRNETAV